MGDITPRRAVAQQRANAPIPHDESEAADLITAVLTASRVLVGISARTLAEVEDTVTLTQFRTLVVLEGHPKINLMRLAELLDVNASTAMRMIDRLLVADLVIRRDNPANRREVLIELSAAGRRIVHRVTTRRHREIARIVEKMPARRRSVLVNALRDFATAAGEPEPDLDAWGW